LGVTVLEARRAIDNGEFRRLQSPFDEIVEKGPPSRLAFAAYVLDRPQQLLAIFPRAQRHERRNRCGRTRTTVPSRVSRTIGSSVSEHSCAALRTKRRLGAGLAQPNVAARRERLLKSRVGYELQYEFPQSTPLIAMLNIHFSRVADLAAPDHIVIGPSVPISCYRDSFGKLMQPDSRASGPCALVD
jgi:hypothetical protein